jgi:hypothetical protein
MFPCAAAALGSKDIDVPQIGASKAPDAVVAGALLVEVCVVVDL